MCKLFAKYIPFLDHLLAVYLKMCVCTNYVYQQQQQNLVYTNRPWNRSDSLFIVPLETI